MRLGKCAATSGTTGTPCAPLASTAARQRQVATVGLDDVTAAFGAELGDGRAGAHGRADELCVAVDEFDDLGRRHVAVGIAP